ncbi:MAG: hypothetical protein M3542_07760 [Acidobacteriota bacterium]|nr:hypothetical protein [Acidobacteriota bacterium]MDQ5873268.1 hypothetical protein [Acidobacteriota bacterium]
MTRQDLIRRAATIAIGGAVLFAFLTAFAKHGFSSANEHSTCAKEEARHAVAASDLGRALALGEDEIAAELARTMDRAFEEYCDCLRVASAESEGVGSRAPLVTVPPRGTPPFAPPRGRPVFTPPAGPPAGRPPVSPPSTPGRGRGRGRPVFTPPGPPPGRPPVTPPGPPPLTPPPTRTP